MEVIITNHQVNKGNYGVTAIAGALEREGFLRELNHDRESSGNTFKITNRGGLFSNSARPSVSMNAQLRLYVDEWLNTGRTNGGTEDPSSRSLPKAPNASHAVGRFSPKMRLVPAEQRDGLMLSLPNRSFPTDANGARRSYLHGPNYSALDEANQLFTLFMLCGWRRELAACRDCGRYFWLKRWNKFYKTGTRCSECSKQRNKGNAKAITKESRDKAKSRLFVLAGKQFFRRISSNPQWHDDPKFKRLILKYLNRKIEADADLKAIYNRGRSGVTTKWLARTVNHNGITKAAMEHQSRRSGALQAR